MPPPERDCWREAERWLFEIESQSSSYADSVLLPVMDLSSEYGSEVLCCSADVRRVPFTFAVAVIATFARPCIGLAARYFSE